MATQTQTDCLLWPQRARRTRPHVRHWQSKNAGRTYRISESKIPGLPVVFYACVRDGRGYWLPLDPKHPPKRFRTRRAAMREADRHYRRAVRRSERQQVRGLERDLTQGGGR